MVSQSLNDAYADGGSQVLWEDGERVFRRGWRLGDNGRQCAVVIVRPAADHPSRSSLDRLTHEYELRNDLDGAWAVRPLDLVHDTGRTARPQGYQADEFLVSAASGEVRLTGFGIASRLERERQSPHPVETIAGTLAYMAPEQTGRMNRSIDSHSDLYALGVTFYQMLTGALPFAAAEPWIGCTPISPGGRWNPPSGGRKAPASCRRSS